MLLHESDVSQFAVRGPLCLLRRDPFLLTLFGFLIQMELKFLAKFRFLAATLDNQISLRKKDISSPS